MATSVLIIEDDLTNMMIVSKVLEQASYHVIQAPDAEIGIRRLIENSNVKLILLDWMLPGMDGIEFLKKIRANNRYRNIRVIMQTGNDSAKDVKTAISAGADDYIIKPIDPALLLSKVIKALQTPRSGR